MNIETTLTFDELSETAKQHARNEHTGKGYLDYDWWDCTYEDAVWMAAILGITISTTSHAGRKPGATYLTTDISFSGFCSQGDGACFEGDYEFAPDAIAKITAETNDEELLRIATELYLLQLARRMSGLEPFSASIKTSGRYSHSGTMDVSVSADDDDGGSGEDGGVQKLEGPVQRLMRDFADWIYKQLETQYDWLLSDECVDEALKELAFDEDGNLQS